MERPSGTRLKTGVLISGRGSNLHALIEACRAPDFPAEVAIVISNRPQAAGLDIARNAGIPAVTLDHKTFPDRASFDAKLHETLVEAGVGIVCLAGYMRLLTPGFIAKWPDHILNIHPSLLPAFRGLHAHEQALAAGVRIAGCTVHIVRPEVDSGPILVQAAVPVRSDDTPDSLAARTLVCEHRIYPLALRLFAEGRVRIDGNIARIDGDIPPSDLINPQD